MKDPCHRGLPASLKYAHGNRGRPNPKTSWPQDLCIRAQHELWHSQT
ncbi:MAG: hypothetical protein ACK55Z_31535 [bacterium]